MIVWKVKGRIETREIKGRHFTNDLSNEHHEQTKGRFQSNAKSCKLTAWMGDRNWDHRGRCWIPQSKYGSCLSGKRRRDARLLDSLRNLLMTGAVRRITHCRTRGDQVLRSLRRAAHTDWQKQTAQVFGRCCLSGGGAPAVDFRWQQTYLENEWQNRAESWISRKSQATNDRLLSLVHVTA